MKKDLCDRCHLPSGRAYLIKSKDETKFCQCSLPKGKKIKALPVTSSYVKDKSSTLSTGCEGVERSDTSLPLASQNASSRQNGLHYPRKGSSKNSTRGQRIPSRLNTFKLKMSKFTSRMKVSKERHNYGKDAIFYIEDRYEVSSESSVETDLSSDAACSPYIRTKSVKNNISRVNKHSLQDEKSHRSPNLDETDTSKSLAPILKSECKPIIQKQVAEPNGASIDDKQNFLSLSRKGLISLRSYFASFRAKLPVPVKQKTRCVASSLLASKKSRSNSKSTGNVKSNEVSSKNVEIARNNPTTDVSSDDEPPFLAEKAIESRSMNDDAKSVRVSSFSQVNLPPLQSRFSYPYAVPLVNRKNGKAKAFSSTPVTSAKASNIMSSKANYLESSDTVMASSESSTSSSSHELIKTYRPYAHFRERRLSYESCTSSPSSARYSKTLPRSASELPLLEWTSLVNLSYEDRKLRIPGSLDLNDTATFESRSFRDSEDSGSVSLHCLNLNSVHSSLFISNSEIPYKSLK